MGAAGTAPEPPLARRHRPCSAWWVYQAPAGCTNGGARVPDISMAAHRYRAGIRWTGNRGTGTREYRGYGRDHVISFPGKESLPGSSDPEFRGDAARYNPEELLVSALAACHMLWYLHLCSSAGVDVQEYSDDADGVMEIGNDGSGRFTLVTLRPRVTIRGMSVVRATELHDTAEKMCFIANSVNFPVRHEPTITVATESAPEHPPRRAA
jgi:organic hydroperoxide reductase OsmC/OhrA